jgi:ABC-type nitrate/sulfonate/bicarbonate transport system substrate-binding protein
MDPPGMPPALITKQVDGYATSLPYTTQAVVQGQAIMLASGLRDAPDLLPFGYGLLYTKPDTCTKSRDKCARVFRALAGANQMIRDKPAEALALLKKTRFDKMDQQVLDAAWKDVSAAHAKDLRITLAQLHHSQKVSLEAKLLEARDELKSFDGLFTDEFVK